MNIDLTLLIGIATALSTIGVTIWGILNIRGVKKTIKTYQPLVETVQELLEYKLDEKGNPMIDARILAWAGAIGHSLMASLQGSILGQMSGKARMEKGLKGAMARDISEKQMPILGLIGEFLGVNTSKYVEKHPEAMMQLANQFLPSLLAQKQGGGSNKPHPYRR